jgi:hypothetical protein
MSQVFLQLADASYVVSQETAEKVQKALPPDKFVTVTPIQEPELRLGPNKSKSSVFIRYSEKLSEKEQGYAQRIAKSLAKSQRR